MIQHIDSAPGTPLVFYDPRPSGRIWDDVAQLAETIMRSSATPRGFVRRDLVIGSTPAQAYAGATHADAARPATIVVVIAQPEDAPPPSDAELRDRFGLTPREAEVALLLASRHSNKEIADRLSIADKTAARHTDKVMAKLRTSSRRDVARILGWDPAAAAPVRLRPSSRRWRAPS